MNEPPSFREIRETRKPDETIPVYKPGGLNIPERFYSRGLCTPEEFPILEKLGWKKDTSRFAANPDKIPVQPV